MTIIEWRETFGKALKDKIEEYGYSQELVADEIGVAQTTISRYITGTRVPSIKAIINLSFLLDCTVDDLVFFDEKIE